MRSALVMLLVVAVTPACKKEEEEEEIYPVLEEIKLEPGEKEWTLSFRAIDQKGKTYTLPGKLAIEIDKIGSELECKGTAVLTEASYVGPEKRVTLALPIKCNMSGALTNVSVGLRLDNDAGEQQAGGGETFDKLEIPGSADSRPPPLPELEAEIARLAEVARNLPENALRCSPGMLSDLDENSNVELVERNVLLEITGPPPDPNNAVEKPWNLAQVYTTSGLFSDLRKYRQRQIPNREDLLANVRATHFMIVLGVEELKNPELGSGHMFQSGVMRGPAYVVEYPTGKTRCLLRVEAHSSSSVADTGKVDLLEQDFGEQIRAALHSSLKDLVPAARIDARPSLWRP
jgi:hypothetical protein